VELVGVTKRFGKVVALDKVSVRVERGEFFTFLGPSGCGKTTTLRIIAGLEVPDEGRVFMNGQDITGLPPYKRNVAMVPQNYALWPHMTVFENVAYGLRVRGVPKDKIRERIREVLELVKLEGLEDRYPAQLSGGQQQRVALARALVVQPRVLLLDEPLSNLDARLRIEMREELKRIQKTTGITVIYVTHDQEEAMVLSDRIAVMNSGKVIEVGRPEDLYRRPRTLFTATFMGKYNILEGKVVQLTREVVIVESRGQRILGTIPLEGAELRPGDEVYLVFRPHSGSIDPKGKESNEFSGEISATSYLGERVEARVKTRHGELLFYLPPRTRVVRKMPIKLYVSAEDILVYPKKPGNLYSVSHANGAVNTS